MDGRLGGTLETVRLWHRTCPRVRHSRYIDGMGELPAVDAPWSEIAAYATQFNAYERWYGDLGTLSTMLEPLHVEYTASGQVPERAGVDALRAWLFVLIRAERFTGGVALAGKGVFVMTDPPENPAVRAIIAALHETAASSPGER